MDAEIKGHLVLKWVHSGTYLVFLLLSWKLLWGWLWRQDVVLKKGFRKSREASSGQSLLNTQTPTVSFTLSLT